MMFWAMKPMGLTTMCSQEMENMTDMKIISGGLKNYVDVPHPLTMIAATQVAEITLNGTVVIEIMTIGT